jgi:hypothetical protein
MSLSFTIAARPRRAVNLGSEFPRLMTTFYCLRFEIPPTWRAKSPYLYPSGTGWPGYTPRHWVSFSSPPTNRRAMVEVFGTTSTWARTHCLCSLGGSSYIVSGWTTQKTPFLTVPVLSCVYPLPQYMFIEPLPSSAQLFWLHYSSLSAAMSQYQRTHQIMWNLRNSVDLWPWMNKSINWSIYHSSILQGLMKLVYTLNRCGVKVWI